MAMIFKGNVSIFSNTKGEVVVKADAEGRFNADNAQELYKTVLEVAKKNKLTPRVYKPEATGDTPILMCDRYGKPYIALLPERKAPSKVLVTKLA